jgi:uncharacterized protein YaeQ
MALTATIRRFQIELSDVDRGVYESVELRAAQHPSESGVYLVTRVLALLLEHREGITFGRGIGEPDDPDVYVQDATGSWDLWIDIGQPSAERMHKVSKLAREVRVYSHKNPETVIAALESGSVHRGDQIPVVAFDPEFLEAVAEELGRNNAWSVLRSEGELYVTVGEATHQTTPNVRGKREA